MCSVIVFSTSMSASGCCLMRAMVWSQRCCAAASCTEADSGDDDSGGGGSTSSCTERGVEGCCAAEEGMCAESAVGVADECASSYGAARAAGSVAGAVVVDVEAAAPLTHCA